MDWYEAEVRALEARSRKPLAAPPIVFYGSSSIRGWQTLAEDLGDPRVLNLGFGGSTLDACAHFFPRLVAPLRPASLVVYAGDNDLGDGHRPAQVLDAFRRLFAQVLRDLDGRPFGFIAIKPSPARVGLLGPMREVNEAIRHELGPHPSAFFIDVFEPMLDARGGPRPELFLADGLHLSAAGYDLWRAILQTFRHRVFTDRYPPVHGEKAGSVVP